MQAGIEVLLQVKILRLIANLVIERATLFASLLTQQKLQKIKEELSNLPFQQRENHRLIIE